MVLALVTTPATVKLDTKDQDVKNKVRKLATTDVQIRKKCTIRSYNATIPFNWQYLGMNVTGTSVRMEDRA